MIEISLALGSGGIRGIAHIGVIRTLEKNGFKITAIAGTSAGALVGSVYAAGQSTSNILAMVSNMKTNELFRRDSKEGPALLSLQGIRKRLSPILSGKDFKDLNIRFACTAVDINSSQEIVFTSTKVMPAVEASIAVPGIFPPMVKGKYILVDGGLIDPVPVAVARWLAPSLPCIAVCLSTKEASLLDTPPLKILTPIAPLPVNIIEYLSKLRVGQAFNIFYQSLDTASRMIAEIRMQIEKPDVIIRPRVGHVHILDEIRDPHELIRLGELAAQEKLDEIEEALKPLKKFNRRFHLSRLPNYAILYQE